MVRKERKQKGLDKFDMIPENRDVRTWVSAYYVCRSEIAISMLQTSTFLFTKLLLFKLPFLLILWRYMYKLNPLVFDK